MEVVHSEGQVYPGYHVVISAKPEREREVCNYGRMTMLHAPFMERGRASCMYSAIAKSLGSFGITAIGIPAEVVKFMQPKFPPTT